MRVKPPERVELPTSWVVARCSHPLSYGGRCARAKIIRDRNERMKFDSDPDSGGATEAASLTAQGVAFA